MNPMYWPVTLTVALGVLLFLLAAAGLVWGRYVLRHFGDDNPELMEGEDAKQGEDEC